MRLAWKNGVAYLLLALALAQYIISAPVYLGQLQYFRAPDGIGEGRSVFMFTMTWLTAPVYIISCAAVVEYLSRIASALQRTSEKP
jgi:hypothetical protein